MHERTEKSPGHDEPLLALTMDLTNRCNLNCSYCYYGEKGNRVIPVETAVRSLANLAPQIDEHGGISLAFMGGEPLVVFPHLQQVVEACHELCRERGWMFRWHAVSNLVRLDEPVAAYFREQGSYVHCSIDGTPEAHAINRTGRVVNLRRPIELALSIDQGGSVRMTVTPETVHLMTDGLVELARYGFGHIACFPAFSHHIVWDERSINELSRQHRRAAIERVEGALRKVRSLHPLDFHLNLAFNDSWQGNPKPYCGAGYSLIGIDLEGNLWPCHRFTNGAHPEFKIGTHYSADFVRRCLPRELDGKCQGCDLQQVCHGGCWAENLEFAGSPIRVFDELCATNQAVHFGILEAGCVCSAIKSLKTNDANDCIWCDGCENCDSCFMGECTGGCHK